MSFQPLIDAYTERLRSLNGAASTIKLVGCRLKRFSEHAQSHGVAQAAEVSTSFLREYQSLLAVGINAHGRGNSADLCNRHVAVLKGFFRYLKHEGLLAHNPAAELEYASTPNTLPKAILNPTEVRKLLNKPDVNTPLGFRDRTILEVFYSTGIRRQELLNLTVEDLNLETGLLMVREGKGKKDRVVPLGRIAVKYLESYINGIRPQFIKTAKGKSSKPPTKALFLSIEGRSPDPKTIQKMIEKYARRARIKTHVTPHTFRHSCATHMIRNNANIRHVQELLGHSQLTTTQKYVRVTINDLQEAHRKHHPREKGQ